MRSLVYSHIEPTGTAYSPCIGMVTTILASSFNPTCVVESNSIQTPTLSPFLC